MRWWRSRGAADPTEGLDLPGLVSLGSTRSGREVRAFRAGADELLPWWHRLRAAHPATQRWPVLLGPKLGDLCWALSGGPRNAYDDAATLAQAQESAPETLRAERQALHEADEAAAPARLTPRPAAFTVAEQDGWIGLVPAAHGWEVPGVLGWAGGLNYDIDPLEHVATLRDWHERFGAELVSLSDDQVLELLVARPPDTTAEAIAVAREQYAYCPDIVDQGVGSCTELAAEHVCSPSWYFWWD